MNAKQVTPVRTSFPVEWQSFWETALWICAVPSIEPIAPLETTDEGPGVVR
jgi:hypothetical protein